MQVVLVAPSGAKSKWGASPNAARPCGRLHWATIVAHFVRRPLRGSSSIFTVVINKLRTLTKTNEKCNLLRVNAYSFAEDSFLNKPYHHKWSFNGYAYFH